MDRSGPQKRTFWTGFHLAVLAAILLAGAMAYLAESPPTRSSSPHRIDVPSPEGRDEWFRQRYSDPRTGRIPEGAFRKSLDFARSLPKRRGVLTKSGADIQWRLKGPLNVGGRTRAVAIDVLDSNTLLAGSVSGGVWRSTDGGKSWTKTTAPDQIHSVTALVQDTRPGRESTWYFGSGEVTGSAPRKGVRGDGIFRSDDGGLTWQQITATSGLPELSGMWRLAIDTTNHTQDELYAATHSGIYRTVDGFRTFTNVLGSSWSSDVAVLSDGSMYATRRGNEEGVIFRSEDGITWEDITPSSIPPELNVQRVVFGVSPSDETVAYFLVYDWQYRLFRYIHAPAQVAFSVAVETPTENDGRVPATFALHQNYPNPFSGPTAITYDLPRPSLVRVTVFDALGRVVGHRSTSPSPRGD